MIELAAGAARVGLAPRRGARLTALNVAGLDLLVPIGADERDRGCFPMAPWAGRLRDATLELEGRAFTFPANAGPHAIHGLVRDRAWAVASQTAREVVLTVPLDDPWPFGGRVVQRVALAPDELALTLEVHADEQPMPAACGWHPWWSRRLTRGELLEVEVHADSVYARDRAGIPTGELAPVGPPPWDDCFTGLGEPAAVLRWPGAATVRVETDAPCVVVFTDPTDAVCVEPQSGPPDGPNFAPDVVQPGEPLVLHTTWRWSIVP